MVAGFSQLESSTTITIDEQLNLVHTSLWLDIHLAVMVFFFAALGYSFVTSLCVKEKQISAMLLSLVTLRYVRTLLGVFAMRAFANRSIQ